MVQITKSAVVQIDAICLAITIGASIVFTLTTWMLRTGRYTED